MREIKKGKLLKVTILRVLLLTVVLVTGICVIVSRIMRAETLRIYRNFSCSCARMVANDVDGDKIEKYLLTGETDDYYSEIQVLLTSMIAATDLEYLYVFVPEDTGIRYIWDARTRGSSRPLRDLWEYTGNYSKDDAVSTYETGEEFFYIYEYRDLDYAAFLTPIYDNDGKIVAVCEADIIMSGLDLMFPKVLINILIWVVEILLVSMAVFVFFTRKRIIVPLEKIRDASLNIVDNLEKSEDIELDIHTKDEIEVVARSIEEMNRRIQTYFHENRQITAERERVKTELDLASKIQSDMLPNLFPPFPDRPEIDIFASMVPAREVGGDFYDFFFVDHKHLVLLIADVSGKGVPAAMFMMMCKSMLQTRTITDQSPARIFEDVNSLVYANNTERMFVTVWLGILDVMTGRLVASNAGHEYPFVKEPDGDFEVIKDKHGFVIGGKKKMKYTDYELTLKPGSKLFIYTDGVPEATNGSNEMFGMERTLDALNRAKDGQPRDILKEVDRSVNDFVGDAEQFDDLTMLCLEYHGGEQNA